MSAARCIAVLLAAGAARRYGGAKQVETVDGVPLVRAAAQAALDATGAVLVVTGAHRAAVEAALAGLPLRFVDNADWSRGMGRSIACAFAQLQREAEPPAAALLCLADQPRVGRAQLQRLLDRHAAEPAGIVVSDYGTRRGPPAVFPAWAYAELAQLDGDEGARTVLRAHADRVVAVPLPEGADDVDTPDDYRRIVGDAPR